MSLPQIMTFLFSGRGIIEQSHRAATAIPAFSIRTKHILKIRSAKCHELFEREIANLRYSANAYYIFAIILLSEDCICGERERN